MKTLIVFAITSLLASWAVAATSANLPGYAVDTEIQFEKAGKVESLSKEIVIDRNSQEWAEIGQLNEKTFVLGRVAKSEGGKHSVEYQIIERMNDKVKVISEPKFLVKNGQQAEAEVGDTPFELRLKSRTSSIFYINE